MGWLTANIGTILCGLLLAVIVFFLVRSTLRNRNSGCGCGRSGCSGCSGCHTSGTINRKGDSK